jgi:multimeric flavodoxin WrbA
MKVLLINGSPHKNGCTYTALKEAAAQCGILPPKAEKIEFTNFIRQDMIDEKSSNDRPWGDYAVFRRKCNGK